MPRCRLFVACLAAAMTFCCAAPGTAAESHRFTFQAFGVGEQTTQEIDFDLDLKLSIEQAGQVIDRQQQSVSRSQRTRMKVLETNGERATRVQVTFEVAEQTLRQKGEEPGSAQQPVVGKTYYAARVDDELVITDQQGRTPPESELAIVTAVTDAIGKPNPIARFFHGRTITVGERLKLPPTLAKDLLGFGSKFSAVSDFELTLVGTREIDGVLCGVFDTKLAAKVEQGTTMTMQMKGQLLLAISTCHAKAMQFNGPVSLVEVHGPPGGQFTVNTAGTMKMSLRAARPALQARRPTRRRF